MFLRLFLSFCLVFLGCRSSGDHVRVGGSAKLMEASHLQKIQRINESLQNQNLPEEQKSQFLCQKGKLYLDLARYEESIQNYSEALSLRNPPSNPSEVHMNLGKAYIGKNEYAKAIQFLNQAERADRNFNTEERKKLVVQSLVAEKEYYPALAALSKSYHKGNQKKDSFYYETAAKTYLKMGYEYKNLGFYKKSFQVASLGLQEYPESETLRSIQRDCYEVLEGK